MLATFARSVAVASLLLATLPSTRIQGCSRALFNKFSDTIVLTGRSMDWEFSFEDMLFVYPRGLKMDGGTGEGVTPTMWTSKYGSVVSSIIGFAEQYGYDFEKDGGTDGINEAGLSAHILYLGETKYPEPNAGGRKNITYMRWLRYILDNFATVQAAVDAMREINIVSVVLYGHVIGCHMAIEDASGDSAVFEIVDGKNTIYHGRDVLIMTNDPTYDEQKALLQKYIGFGGDLPLPGSTSSDDRFVRLSAFLPFLKEPTSDVQAVAKVKSLMMSSNVPFDAPAGYDVNTIFPSWWNSYCDMTHLVYYFDWLETPFMLWTKLKDLDFSPTADILTLDPKEPTLYGDISSLFVTTKDYKASLHHDHDHKQDKNHGHKHRHKSGAGVSQAQASLLGPSFDQNVTNTSMLQSISRATIFAAMSGCAIGFFVHKMFTEKSNRSQYSSIPEQI